MELHALRSKLNPHFIFNTFGSIQLYINNNQLELSEKYLILLSKHIRNVFEYSHLQNISLEKEISLLKDYLEIEKTRFGDKIHIDIKIDPHLNIKTRQIPSMLVQPFVENSMVHGLFHKEGVGNLLISFTYIDSNTYEVKIVDDGIGFTEKSSQRLSSTKVTNERVNLINQARDFKVKIDKSYLDETKVEKGTVITILIKKLHNEGNIGG
jgi:LytS/YehU family sensor histidine kinase